MSTSHQKPDVSICIVSWNTRELLADCLESIEAGQGAARHEVIVVDNASTDHSADMVQNRFPSVRLECSGHNLGFARGSNRAMELARGRYLMLLNPDTHVHPDALGGLVGFMDREPDVGAAGPRLVDPAGRLQLSCGRSPGLALETLNKFMLHKLFPAFKLGYWDHARVRDVGWVTGACVIVRQEALRTAGPLDAAMFMFYEDVEWCMRIQRAGWRVVYYPDSEVVHLGGQSVRQDFRRMLVISQRSQFYLYHKHHGAHRLQLLRLLTVFEMLLRIGIWLPRFVMRSSCGTAGSVAGARLQAYREIIVRTVTDSSYWAPFAPEPVNKHQ